MKIAFVHPDLGIGGAERLVIDAAVGLQNLGHEIVVYTSYRDKSHCFNEARDGTLKVRVRGDSIFPSNISGRFSILCAILRQIHLACTLIKDEDTYDAIFIDQLSTAIPLLKSFLPSTSVLFYCHFPDKLLSQRTSLLKKLYRIPFDLIEEWTTSQADTLVVNSKFTKSIFKKSFPRISVQPKVVYPCVDVHQSFTRDALQTDRTLLLSINRFERKKNLGLAISAFANLKGQPDFERLLLVVAGGHDERVKENVEYHHELQQQCDALDLQHETIRPPYRLPLSIGHKFIETNVIFLLSVPGELKASLLASSQILLYTPMHEHFGIVPIEASLAQLPVLAQDNGGPLETVSDGATGFLRSADSQEWSSVIKHILFDMSEDDRVGLGRHGREQVIKTFSQESMAHTLDHELHEMRKQPTTKPVHNTYAMALLALFLFSLWKWALKPILLDVLAK